MGHKVPHCGACCKTQNCSECLHCLPRYLCCNVKVSVITGTGTGSIEPPCCTHFSFRMVPSTDPVCGWMGSGGCLGANFGSLFVEILDASQLVTGTGSDVGTGTGTGCFTRVTGSLIETHIDFEGILHYVEFSVQDKGINYDVIISQASMVTNPNAFDKCAVCTCVTCLPSALCVRIATEDGTASTLASWDCESKSWIGGSLVIDNHTGTGTGSIPQAFSIALNLSDTECSIVGSLSGPAEAQFLIPLESSSGGGNGAICNESGGSVSIGGNDKQPYTLTTIVNFYTTLHLASTGSGTGPVASLYITDASCGQDCDPECKAGCCSPVIRDLKAVLIPVINCGHHGHVCTPVPFILSPTGPSGNMWVSNIVPQSIAYCVDNILALATLTCNKGSWNLTIVGGAQCTGDDNPTASADTGNILECDAVLLSFKGMPLCGNNEFGVTCVLDFIITN